MLALPLAKHAPPARPSASRGARRASPKPPLAAKLLSLLTASSDDAVAPESSAPVPTLHPDTTATHPKLRTVSGQPVQTYALGGNREVRQPADLAVAAREHGVNYFFAYSMRDDQIGDYLDGLARLCADPVHRKKIFVAVGMEDFTNHQGIVEHVEKCLARLGTDYVDAFFLEYVCRGDEEEAIDAIRWMRGPGGLVVGEGGRAGVDGPVRYVGCSTHDRCVGVKLLRSERRRGNEKEDATGTGTGAKSGRVGGDASDAAAAGDEVRASASGEGANDVDSEEASSPSSSSASASSDTSPSTLADLMRKADEDIAAMAPCELDFLMARYNMAHAKAEWRLFPLAQARDVPVVAFTSTRWNSLQRGHPRWDRDPPTTAECMAWAAGHDATQVVLNSPHSLDQLRGWVEGLARVGAGGMDQDARETWREYGELVYEEGADFETLY